MALKKQGLVAGDSSSALAPGASDGPISTTSDDVTAPEPTTAAPSATIDITYSLHQFVGGVDNAGLLETVAGVQWIEAEYASESDLSDFKTTMDVDVISEDSLDGLLDGTAPAGMTPMITRLKQTVTETILDTGEDTGKSSEPTQNLTNESLYAFAPDDVLYPTDPVTNDNGLQTYNLSTDEINSLKQQFDLAQETDHVDDGTAWGGIYGSQFSSYVDELTQDLINHMGVLLKPVINFHKTKNNKITDNEISSLGRFDSSLSKISINTTTTTTTTTDSEYES